MNKNEKIKEKELKYLIYLKNQLIKETKKEIKQYYNELNNLGNTKIKKINERK